MMICRNCDDKVSKITIINDLLIPNNRDYYLIIDTNKSIIVFINGQLTICLCVSDTFYHILWVRMALL